MACVYSLGEAGLMLCSDSPLPISNPLWLHHCLQKLTYHNPVWLLLQLLWPVCTHWEKQGWCYVVIPPLPISNPLWLHHCLQKLTYHNPVWLLLQLLWPVCTHWEKQGWCYVVIPSLPIFNPLWLHHCLQNLRIIILYDFSYSYYGLCVLIGRSRVDVL